MLFIKNNKNLREDFMWKKKVILGLFLGAFSLSAFSDEIDTLLENKDKLPPAELQKKISEKKAELWRKYLEEKENKEKLVVNQDGQIENGLTTSEQQLQNKGLPPSNYSEETQNLSPKARFACIDVVNVKGVSLSNKTQFSPVLESLGEYRLIFAIDNETDMVYLNDGTNKPFVRLKNNIFQRNISLMSQNDILDTWVIDPENKKAMFSQIKIGNSIGSAVKSMEGDLARFYISNDCYKTITEQPQQ